MIAIENARLFQELQNRVAELQALSEVGRTLVVQMDNMSYLSLYEEAIRLEPRAREALERAGDARYLCNLEIALGNFYYRLNRFAESLVHYDRARQMTENPFQIAAIGISLFRLADAQLGRKMERATFSEVAFGPNLAAH